MDPAVNPDAIVGAPRPTSQYVTAAGCRLYVEVRGSGPALLVIGAADEDAEVYRGIAERLASGATVVTYDRRGTGQSGQEDWPCSSDRHADDAAAILRDLRLDDATVVGTSAGGIVALRLALRHPDLLRTVMCFEPGIFGVVDAGRQLQIRVESAVVDHLEINPDDWSGALGVLGRTAVESTDIEKESLFNPPEGREWFIDRAATYAESLIRGDFALTREDFDLDTVANCPVDLRFVYGTASLPVFELIVSRLAGVRGEQAEGITGMGHVAAFHPDELAEYVRRHL